MASTDFMLGFGSGFLVAIVLGGFFWNIYRNWRRTVDAPDRKQPIIHLTEKTPRQVMEAAAAAWTKAIVLVVFLVVGLWMVIEITLPGFAEFVHALISNLWTMLFG